MEPRAREYRSRDESRRKWVRRAKGAAAGMGPVGAILVLTMSSLGASAGHTFVAPYLGAHVTQRNIGTMSGCGGGANGVHAFFNKTSGIGGFTDNASTKWCTTSTNNSANFQGVFGVNFPFHVKTSGLHSIVVVWLTVATGSVNLTAGTCTGSSSVAYSGCTRSAAAFVYGSASILDKTNGSKFKLSNHWPGNSTYVSNYTSCVYTRCSSTASKMSSSQLHTGNAYWAWYWNNTMLNASHNYTIKMSLNGGVTLKLMTNGATLAGASADGQLNSATLGNEEDLFSITIN